MSPAPTKKKELGTDQGGGVISGGRACQPASVANFRDGLDVETELGDVANTCICTISVSMAGSTTCKVNDLR